MDVGPAWSLISSSPWVTALFVLGALVILSRVYLRVRWAHLAVRGRDDERRFTGATRTAVLRRAGNRCEHHLLYRWRCRETTHLEVDHIHPHSRGGSTSLRNGQVLCKRHNRLKGARIPFSWETRRLATLRSGYFPPGIDPTVVRREESTPSDPARPLDVPDRRSGSDDSGLPVPDSTPEAVLELWQFTYRVPLDAQLTSDFLSHPAMAEITGYSPDRIAQEMPHHQHLAALATALAYGCHR